MARTMEKIEGGLTNKVYQLRNRNIVYRSQKSQKTNGFSNRDTAVDDNSTRNLGDMLSGNCQS